MAPVVQALKQAWWAPLAGLLVLLQLVMAVAVGTDTESDESDVVVWIAVALIGALLLAAGLWKRPQARGLGNALIVVGAALAAVFFWTLVMPVLAFIVVVGVVTSDVRSRRLEPAAKTP